MLTLAYLKCIIRISGKGLWIMPNTIKAIYENGVLRPLSSLKLAEHEEVEIVILQEGDDIPSVAIARMAHAGKSFTFLADPAEDIYTPQDGEPV
jgi:predicted DNA-binding antitoxin AbrB/MazE fold protein